METMLAGHSISQTPQVLSGEGSSRWLGKGRPGPWELVREKDELLTAQDDGDEFDADFEDEEDEDDDFEDDLDEFEDDFDDEFDDDEDDDDFEEEDF